MQPAPAPVPPFIFRSVERLVRSFAPERIVLFGSYAKGTSHPRSDVDLLVVADLEGDLAIHLRRARQLTSDSFPPTDIALCRPEDLLDMNSARSAFLLSVIGSGITVYEA